MSSEEIMINDNEEKESSKLQTNMIKKNNEYKICNQSRRKQIKRSIIKKGYFCYETLNNEDKKIFDKLVKNRLNNKDKIRVKKAIKDKKRNILMDELIKKNDYNPFITIGWDKDYL